MRRNWLVFLVLILSVFAVPALAQTTGTGSGFNVSWSALNPGNDKSAQIIQNIFPTSGSNGVSPTQTTVIGQMIGQLTGFVAAIAMVFLCYSTIVQIHRGSETGRLLGSNMTMMFAVRLGVAAIMMFPSPTTGFSTGQRVVVQMSLWGIGMAQAVYANVIQAIGPQGMVIAQPMIPGTETIVVQLIQNELCRSLVNIASNTMNAGTQLVPEPTPVQVGSTNPQTILAYGLSVGNIGSAPVCGTVSIPAPAQSQTNLAGVQVDQSAIQKQALTTVLQNDIANQVAGVAQTFYMTRNASSLAPLMAVLTSATQDYTNQLTSAATQVTQSLRSALQASSMNDLANVDTNLNQVKALGWTGAGAYYLEFARLNGQTLSLLSGVPQVTAPSYDGLGPSLSSDLAPLTQASQAFMTTLQNYVTTTDGLSAPGGQGDLFSGATPGQDGASLLDQVFRRMHLSDYALQLIQSMISPTGNNWTDPFSGLMTLGNTMVTLALGAMGLAALLSSGTATAATTAFQVLTFHWGGAAATVGGHMVMSFLATPIFALLLGLLIPGLTIAFVLPMIPWVMWMAGVIGWLILVCEAVIAVPLWMLAHMTMSGEGLHGNAREGYSLIFNVLFRPTLMLFGLFLGYFIFATGSWLIRETFGVAAGFLLEHGWIVTNVLGVVVLMSIFVMTHVIMALTAFRMISLIPHHVPRWLGFSGAGRVDMDQFGRDAALVGIGGALRTMNQGLVGGMEKAGTLPGKTPALAAPAALLPSPTSPRGGMDSTLRSTTDLGPDGSEEA